MSVGIDSMLRYRPMDATRFPINLSKLCQRPFYVQSNDERKNPKKKILQFNIVS
jgi:hypothetical protein